MAQVVHVTFMGTLDDGRVILQKSDEEIQLGMRQMWGTAGDLGLFTMAVGERALIVCEHEFGAISGGVSQRVTFDVQLLSIVDPATISAREHRVIGFFILLTLVCVFLMQWKAGYISFGGSASKQMPIQG
eukprot:CAMPEP_0181205104 /NCGR_PEP_ID=MMETSP1096-20121128/20289_1 /TAXON_ID=156174 ORGANISM="Chrysochromulina ericina, Strain CCMP281" /NCGR_SAMPLE_ID=MMETSP1096 /ASSEMBLY_ACC=CAM_ASM_000453 /LENGTH=129 /DNA_ID=CAMNT_0023295845 /DNA_START=234 /DNA_END=623 /DNA_ORIENTATION=-